MRDEERIDRDVRDAFTLLACACQLAAEGRYRAAGAAARAAASTFKDRGHINTEAPDYRCKCAIEEVEAALSSEHFEGLVTMEPFSARAREP